MKEVILNVKEEAQGTRVDAYISQNIPELSRARATELIKNEKVWVNDTIKKAKYKVMTDDVVRIIIPENEVLEILGEDIELDILYEDADVLVVNKPSGMVVHPSFGHKSGTLVNGLMYAIKDLSGINGTIRPGIVHRIDKDTSGLLMVAKNDNAHQKLSDQLKDKTVKREYIALVHGTIDHELGKIDAPIGRDHLDRIRYTVVENGKPSITHFQVLKRYKDYTLIKCRLETGRTHQIRVHMRYIGHPLVGDPLYGPRKTYQSNFGQFLHAKSIGFIHPVTNEYLEFETNLPPDFTSFLNELD